VGTTASSEPDPSLVIAALLHDSIEDVGVSKEELTRRFGPKKQVKRGLLTKNIPSGRPDGEFTDRSYLGWLN